MKQIGNLAIIVSTRDNATIKIGHNIFRIEVRLPGSKFEEIQASCDDEEEINRIIFELNFGKFKRIESENSHEKKEVKD